MNAGVLKQLRTAVPMSFFFTKDPQLDALGTQVLEATWAQFPNLARTQIAMTWLVYDPPVLVNTGGALRAEEFWKQPVRGFSYRGMELIYPASIVKLFYLVAVYEWLAKGMMQPSAELERATRDMIVDSSNDATSLVVDMLTGTTSGPEISSGPFETWAYQRNMINRYFQGFNWPEFERLNANQKTWCDGAYGRERQFLGKERENRNMLTTDATARLVHSIIGGVAVSAQASQAMMNLMRRSLDPASLAADPDNQVTGFIGAGVPQTATVWSKAGLTSQVRHDAAYVELPGLRPYTLVVFTDGKEHSTSEVIIPFVAQQVVAAIANLGGI
jgi:hypothetical protein